jgi:hypothetical protein
MGRGKGMEDTGKKTPHRNIMGKRKKLDMVMASKTSFTPTEIRIPSNEKARLERIMMNRKEKRCFTEMPIIGIKKIVIKNVIINPNRVLPSVLPKRMVLIFNGASISLSRAPILFSKVITMAAMDVHEKRRVNPINPGTTSLIPIGFLK